MIWTRAHLERVGWPDNAPRYAMGPIMGGLALAWADGPCEALAWALERGVRAWDCQTGRLIVRP
jgi:fructose-1,6-bisphosphatase/inositol monophosphatase family enzyme